MKLVKKVLLTALTLLAVLLLRVAPARATNVGGGITTNTTWTAANSPYVVTSTIVVYNSARLTIQAGVTVEFNSGTAMDIGYYNYPHCDGDAANCIEMGALTVAGTAAQPVVFTSSSGATNGWEGLAFGAATSYGGIASSLSYLTVMNAGQGNTMGGTIGSTSACIQMYSTGSTFTFDDVSTTSCTGIGLIAYSSTLTATSVTSTGNTSYGVWAYASTLNLSGSNVSNNGSYGAYYQSSGGSVSGDTFASNASYGLYTAGAAPSITSNTFTGNGNYAIYYNISDAPTITGNTMTGDAKAGIQVNGGGLSVSHAWSLQSGETDFTVTGSPIVVYNSARLTVGGGSNVYFSSGTALDIGYYNYPHCDGDAANCIEMGALTVNGTASLPVLFTSTSGATGGWEGVAFGTASQYGGLTSSLSYLTIANAGQGNTMGTTVASTSAGLIMYGTGTNFSFNNVAVNGSSGDGYYINGSQLGNSSVIATSCSASGNATYDMYMVGSNGYTSGMTLTSGGVDGGWFDSTTVTLLSPTVTGNTEGLHVRNNATPTVSGGTISNNTNYGVFTEDLASHVTVTGATVNGNGHVMQVSVNSTVNTDSFSGNTSQGIYMVGGGMAANGHWYLPGTGTFQPYILLETTVVYNSARVTVDAGATVEFASGVALDIGYYNFPHCDGDAANCIEMGALTVAGTAAAPVTFTSQSGATNGWEGLAFGAATSYGGIASSLSYLTVANAGQGNTMGGTIGSTSADVQMYSTGSTFSWDHVQTNTATGIGLIVYSSSLTATNGTATGNTSYGVWAYASTLNMSGATVGSNGSYGAYYQSSGGSISGDTFANNASYGLYTAGAAPSITSNTFTGNGNYAIYYNISDAPTITGNTMTGDAKAGIQVNGGGLAANHAWSLQSGETDFTVTGSPIVVYNSARLTVGGGSTVYFSSGTALDIGYYNYPRCDGDAANCIEMGALTVNGTASLPVLFTSTSGATGGWEGVAFGTSTDYGGLTSSLSYLTIANAGQGNTMGTTVASTSAGLIMYGTGTNFSFTNVAVNGSSGDGYYINGSQLGNSSVIATSCSASGNATYDMYMVGSNGYTSGMTLTSGGVDGGWFDSTTVTLLSPTVTGNTEGLHARNNATPTVSGGTISNNTNYGVFTEDLASHVTVTGATVNGNGHVMQVSVNSTVNTDSFSGNTSQGIYMVGGGMAANGHWYLPGTGTFQPYILLETTVVYNSARVTVDAGVTVEFASGVALDIGYYNFPHCDGDAANCIEMGALTVAGTAAAPVTFTSQSGATNGWEGLAFGAATSYGGIASSLSYLTVANAGQGNTMGGTIGSTSADVQMYSTGSTFSWDHVQTNTATGIGLIVYSSSLTATNGTATGNTSYGVWAYASTLNMSGATVGSNGSYGAYYQSSGGSISGDTFANNASYGLYTAGAAPSIAGNTFTSNHNYAMYYNIGDAPTITGNAMSGDTNPGIQVNGGGLAANHTWSTQTGEPFFTVTGSPVVVYNSATLTVAAGNTIKFSSGTALDVGYYNYPHCDGDAANCIEMGSLQVQGNDEAPVLFTAANGNAGGWEGIFFGAATSYGGILSTLDYVIIEKGGQGNTLGGTVASNSANLAFYSDSQVVNNATIAQGSGAGIYSSASSPTIRDTIVAYNGTYGLYAVSGGAPSFTYGDTNSNTSGNVGWAPSTGSIAANPDFVNETAGNYNLGTGSPCIGAGVVVAGLAHLGTNPDMGALQTGAIVNCANPSTPAGAACGGTNPCFQTYTCQNLVCAGSNPIVCAAQDQCHVAGVCNTMTGACSNPAANDGTACNDDNACTQTDTCQSGVCTGSNPVVCAALDQCHVAGTCNTATGVCSNPSATNGTACAGTNPCYETNTCESGICAGSNPVVCHAEDSCHVAGVCDPSTGQCTNPNIADGTACSGASACMQTNLCSNGVCTGSNPIVCAQLDQCHGIGTCDPSTGVCDNPDLADGTACNDGNACTSNDVCTGGTCAGTAYGCAATSCQTVSTCNGNGGCNVVDKPAGTSCPDDGNPCTSDVCDGSGDCTHPAVANGTSCGSGLVCVGATCTSGCDIGGVVYAAGQTNPTDPCQVCVPSQGGWSDVTNGTACDDGNACTQTDTCQNGACVGSDPVVCEASDGCHTVGTCNPSTGVCSNPTEPDGTACAGASACMQTNTCQAGVCTGSNPVVCAAIDECHTAGTCDPSTGTCSNPALPDGTSCNDGDACTQTDLCESGTCTGTNPVVCAASDPCHAAGVCNPSTGACSNPLLPDGTSCNDGDACTRTDVCNDGTCVGTNPVVCAAADPCNTAGACDPATGVCSAPAAVPDGTSCDDGDACTQTDLCESGTCTGTNPVVCEPSDSCHVAGTCDPSTGVCDSPAAANGTACNDGDACTQTDLCENGTCTGTNPVVCAPVDGCHGAGYCDTATGQCSSPALPDGTACGGSTGCNQANVCQGGACTGVAAVPCPPIDQCHAAGTCDEATGQCSTPALPDGTACDDGDACTQGDTCQSGVCAGSPVACAPSDQCHAAGVCDPVTGACSSPVAPNGTACNDGDGCTQTDVCENGACRGTDPVVCAAIDPCHTAGTCDPATGACSNPDAPDGTGCDDGDACSLVDACKSGVCTALVSVICTAGDQCHVPGVCDPSTGICSQVTATDGTACDDANNCTMNDTCQAGVCTGTQPLVCTALDQCHAAGVCDPSTGYCSNPPVADGTACDDGDPCTLVDTCQSGTCSGSSPVVCTATDPCHAPGVCDPSTGVCSNPDAPNGTLCDDGDPCTLVDTCQNGACAGGDPVVCAALDACHAPGVCDPSTGLCSEPLKPDGTACNDGDACTLVDTCQGGVCDGSNPVVCAALDQCHVVGVCDPSTGVCSNPDAPDGTVCNDANGCTAVDVCVLGACTGTGMMGCAPSDQCHAAGTCDPSTGACTNPAVPNGTACNDGNPCTQNDTCENGTCAGGSPVACAALDACHTAGTCDPSTGQCSNPAAPNGTACNDGDPCTQTDTCQGGACTGSDPVVCAALDPCHAAGSCDPSTGQCSNPAAPNGTACNDGNACTQTDTCQGGACTGNNPVVCAAQDACHVAGTCNPATGVCSNPTASNGAPTGGGVACNTGLLGVCAAGTTTCQNGAIVCQENVQPSSEVCDGLDNNCNGQVDEGNPGGGLPCNTGKLGVCAAGTTECVNGAIVCQENVQPSPEVCDGLDNDCDGIVDDETAGSGVTCATDFRGGGVCGLGTTACVDAGMVCAETPQCSLDEPCTLDSQCASGVCTNGFCQALPSASCVAACWVVDGECIAGNGNTLDLCIAVCDDNLPCIGDCQAAWQATSSGCDATATQCQSDCLVGTCTDGIQDDGETGVDCGGPCEPCSCSDGIQDDGETGVDCGGPCLPCAGGQGCNVGSDCQSGVCNGGACAGATCVTFRGDLGTQVQDQTIWSSNPTGNLGAYDMMEAGTSRGVTFYALLSWGIGSSIPPGAVVTSAQVKLLEAGASPPGTPVNVYRITTAWSEPTVTYASFNGAFDPSVVATVTTGNGSSLDVFSLPTDLVQAWVSGTTPNDGILFWSSSGRTEWNTTEAGGGAGSEPELDVCYFPN